jgi:hypothetical protein
MLPEMADEASDGRALAHDAAEVREPIRIAACNAVHTRAADPS